MIRACVFVCFESGPFRAAAREAIRSVTHLVLARLDQWLIPQFRTERSGPDVSCPAPSGSVFLGQLSSTPTASLQQAYEPLLLRPPRITPGPENFQCRAAFIQYQRGPVLGRLSPARSNPSMTRDTVESPAKYLLSQSKLRRTAATNQSGGIGVQPFQRARDGSQNHSSSSWFRIESRCLQSDRRALNPTPLAG
jgi:hypothetical protein